MLCISDEALHTACGLTLQAMSRHSSDAFKRHNALAMPLVFLAMHATKEKGKILVVVFLFKVLCRIGWADNISRWECSCFVWSTMLKLCYIVFHFEILRFWKEMSFFISPNLNVHVRRLLYVVELLRLCIPQGFFSSYLDIVPKKFQRYLKKAPTFWNKIFSG